MRHFFSTLICTFISGSLFAQSNTFPATGNVGINTTAPISRLSVYRNAPAPTTIDFNNSITVGVQNANANNKFLGQFGFFAADVDFTTPKIVAFISGEAAETYTDDTKTGSMMRFYTGSDGATNPVERMVIDNKGRLGINTSTPLAKLDIKGPILFGDGTDANIDPANTANGNLGYLANSSKILLGWNRSAGGGEADFISNRGGGTTGGFAFYDYSNSGTQTQLMWLRGDGSLAIGTNDPKGYKLAVNGSAIATSVTVKLQSAWPDYVFKPNYELPSLEEVKRYIRANGHLPEIPSENEVREKGLDLGEMNRVLVKKVEELTLHLITKEGQVKSLEEKLGKLQEQVDKILKKLE